MKRQLFVLLTAVAALACLPNVSDASVKNRLFVVSGTTITFAPQPFQVIPLPPFKMSFDNTNVFFNGTLNVGTFTEQDFGTVAIVNMSLNLPGLGVVNGTAIQVNNQITAFFTGTGVISFVSGPL